MRRSRLMLSLAGANLLLAGGVAGAQSRFALLPPGRVQVEGFLSRYHYDGPADSRLAGGGGRVLWSLSHPQDSTESGLARRTAVGLFAVAMSAPGMGSSPATSAWHAGAQIDLRPFSRPLPGRIEPVISLGLGAFREEIAERPVWLVRPTLSGLAETAGAVVPEVPRSLTRPRTDVLTSAAVAPAIGARVWLAPRTSLRVDYRDVMTLRNERRRGAELLAGLSVTL